MLERAKACLQSGARETLRSKSRPPRSRCSLHSTFWSHGASTLDLPPIWAVPDSPPVDTSRDGRRVQHRYVEGSRKQEMISSWPCTHDTPFLDFLYPPQALALLHRAGSGGQQLERWEGRNARRLPEGFVQASRGYSSRSRGTAADLDPNPENRRQEMGHSTTASTLDCRNHDERPADLRKDELAGSSLDESDDILPSQDLPFSKNTLDTIADLHRLDLPEKEPVGGTSTRAEGAKRRGPASHSASVTTAYRLVRHDDAAISTGDLAEQERYDATAFTDQHRSIEDSPVPVNGVPGDADGAPHDRLQRLQRIMATPGTTPSRDGRSDNHGAHREVDRVLRLYQGLPDELRNGIRLRLALLEWLALFRYRPAEDECLVLYESLTHTEMPLSAYSAAMAVFMRRRSLSTLASLYQEAVLRLPISQQLAREYFKFAVINEQWDLAFSIESGRREAQDGPPGMHEAILWVDLSNTPGLLPKAFRLITHHQNSLRRTPEMNTFCARFCKEALIQEFNAGGSAGLPSSFEAASLRKPRIQRDLRKIVAQLQHLPGKDGAKVYNSLLVALLREHARFDFRSIYWLVSSVYFCIREDDSYKMPISTFATLLGRLTYHLAQNESQGGSNTSLSIPTLTSDWIRDHGKLEWRALVRTMEYYARTARPIEVARWMKYLQSSYPGYDAVEEVLWTTIHAHARKADVEAAQRAFADARFYASENNRALPARCWNALLFAYSRVNNISGCLSTLQSMIEEEVEPDDASFLAVLVVLGKRGDVGATKALMGQYEDLTSEKPPAHFYASLISAHMKRREIAEAEDVLYNLYETISSGRLSGSMSWPCNTILMAHAARRDIDSTMRVYQWMKSHDIRTDERTFAALMQALAHHAQTNAAWKMLRVVMPEQKLRPTAIHYAIIMRGYLHQGMLEEALMVHSHMTTQNIKSTHATNAVYLQVKARYEENIAAAPEDIRTRGSLRSRLQNRDFDSRSQSSSSAVLSESIEDLKRILGRLDGTELADTSGSYIPGPDGSSDTSSAALFASLIFVHGKRGCFNAVHELYAQYRKQRMASAQAADPAVIVYALMDALLNAGDYAEVEKYWLLMKKQADETAPPMNVMVPDLAKGRSRYHPHADVERGFTPAASTATKDEPLPGLSTHAATEISEISSIGFNPVPQPTSTPGFDFTPPRLEVTPEGNVKARPAVGKSLFLSAPLRLYIQALFGQNRMLDIITTFSDTLNQGYQLDIRTWNTFIEQLCLASPPLTLLACVLTEKYLVPQFPGWVTTADQKRPRFLARKQNLQYIRAQFLPPGLLMPQYSTLVYLGAAVLQLRRLENTGALADERFGPLRRYMGSLKQVRKLAPKTLYAVQTMPNVMTDELQSRVIRRER